MKDLHGEKWFTMQPHFEKKNFKSKLLLKTLSMHSPIKFSIGHCAENGECTSTPLRPSARIPCQWSMVYPNYSHTSFDIVLLSFFYADT